MEITVNRIAKEQRYTIGKLSIDGEYFCDTLEDTDRGLRQDMPLEEIRRAKVSGSTAIPAGTYRVRLDVVSPKYYQREEYRAIGGRMPRLEGVPGYEGVLIHSGNSPEDTEGCLLVGNNRQAGMVLDSKKTFWRLYEKLQQAEEISLTIV